MKTPSNEIKARFFSLYLNQDVIVLPGFMSRDANKICRTTDLTTEMLNAHKDGPAYLQLRTIDQLSETEHDVVCRLEGWFGELKDLMVWISDDFNKAMIDNDNMSNRGIDYLRSMGILIPYTFVDETNTPQTLTINDLLELKWVKGKE